MSDLPTGWKLVAVGEVGRVVTGKTPPTKETANWGGNVPSVTGGVTINDLAPKIATIFIPEGAACGIGFVGEIKRV